MTKADLIERIHFKTGFSKKESFEILESLFTHMKVTLESGENIKIAGFGNFGVKQKKDRKGRNPHTGADICIESRRIEMFKSSAVLRQIINK